MSEATLLQGNFRFAQDWLEGTMEGVTPEIAHWHAGGKTQPIAANYVHVITGLDYFVNALIRGGAPLMVTEYAGKAGFSEPPPMGNREDWATSVTVDLPAVRSYAKAVYAATDEYLSNASDAEISRMIDMSAFGFGTQPVSFVLGLMLLNIYCHAGEISCLKGLKGLQGYPG